MKETVDVVVDVGENKADDLITAVALHPEVESWKMRSLSSGDIKIGDVRFERKTPSDFAASVTGKERNIKEQLTKMIEESGFACLLIEGERADFFNLEYTNIKPEALCGMAARITRSYCPVLYCGDADGVIDTAVRIARKDIEPENDFIRTGGVTGKDVPYILRALTAVDGVSIVTAADIAEHYDSVADLATASEDDLMAIDGVGEVRAQTIVEAIHGHR